MPLPYCGAGVREGVSGRAVVTCAKQKGHQGPPHAARREGIRRADDVTRGRGAFTSPLRRRAARWVVVICQSAHLVRQVIHDQVELVGHLAGGLAGAHHEHVLLAAAEGALLAVVLGEQEGQRELSDVNW